MALPLLAIGTGLQAGSSLMQGFIGARQKKNEAAVAKYNAEVKRMEAETIKRRTKFMQSRQAEMATRIQGELEAAIGGSGLVATEGAPLMSLALQKSESELENYLIGLEGRMAAGQAESAASEYDMMRSFAKTSARQSILGGFLGAGADIGQGLTMSARLNKPPVDLKKTSLAYKSYRPSSGYGTFS